MIRLLLILVILIQLSGCASIFWQTVGGTVLGNIGAGVIKEEYNKEEDEKKVKAPQP